MARLIGKLIEVINREHLETFCELGVLKGATLQAVLKKCPDVNVIGIDAWDDSEGDDYTQYYPDHDHEQYYQTTLNRTSRYADRCRIIRDTTINAAKQIPDASLDMIYIDANHEYESVCEDIATWQPKLKPGGWMTGDDYDWPGVNQAVNEIYPTAKTWKNKIWYVERKG